MTSGHVVTYSPLDAEALTAAIAPHELESFADVAAQIAKFIGMRFAGEYDPVRHRQAAPLYFVPIDTLLTDQASALGIAGEQHFFGGCVPHPFVATKSISHGLIHPDAAAPVGWSPQFTASVAAVVLPGYSAFAKADALTAAERLLTQGAVRIKAPLGRGGCGQTVVVDSAQVRAALDAIDAEACANYGIVLEKNLGDIATRSIGTLAIGALQISYCGTQYLTANARGHSVYGGSSLRAVRGDLTALANCDLPHAEKLAVAQAGVYDRAARAHFPGFFASRRNYDVVQGVGKNREFCSGVLEQSWRIGGASPAEMAAFEMLWRDPQVIAVRASCREVYTLDDPPPHAHIYFRGEDKRAGMLTKYATLDACEYAPS